MVWGLSFSKKNYRDKKIKKSRTVQKFHCEAPNKMNRSILFHVSSTAIKADAMLVQTTFAEVSNQPKLEK